MFVPQDLAVQVLQLGHRAMISKVALILFLTSSVTAGHTSIEPLTDSKQASLLGMMTNTSEVSFTSIGTWYPSLPLLIFVCYAHLPQVPLRSVPWSFQRLNTRDHNTVTILLSDKGSDNTGHNTTSIIGGSLSQPGRYHDWPWSMWMVYTCGRSYGLSRQRIVDQQRRW